MLVSVNKSCRTLLPSAEHGALLLLLSCSHGAEFSMATRTQTTQGSDLVLLIGTQITAVLRQLSGSASEDLVAHPF